MRKDSGLKFKIYIDFDPKKNVFYHNFFFEEVKFVLKIALTASFIYEKKDYNKDIAEITSGDNVFLKYEKFNLAKYTYLFSYE